MPSETAFPYLPLRRIPKVRCSGCPPLAPLVAYNWYLLMRPGQCKIMMAPCTESCNVAVKRNKFYLSIKCLPDSVFRLCALSQSPPVLPHRQFASSFFNYFIKDWKLWQTLGSVVSAARHPRKLKSYLINKHICQKAIKFLQNSAQWTSSFTYYRGANIP